MRRTLLLVVVVLAGCGQVDQRPFVPASRAEPQQVDLGWREVYPAAAKRLVFEVHELEIRADGWSAAISVTNQTGVAFETGKGPTDHSYGLMLFDNANTAELQESSSRGTLPAVRKAAAIEPSVPPVLRAGATWRATLSAPGALAAESWVRVAFGPFRAVGAPPEGIEPIVFWITDRSTRLR
ncbi:MAG: hypothetical protein M3R12_06475 [Actinomycetota bacterium]|nr:hypothetical protein [Actinomycetota bacterium]